MMRDVYSLLREKENAIEKIRREVQALRSVSPLLVDAGSSTCQPDIGRQATNGAVNELGEALRTAAPLLADDAEDFDPEIRARLVEASERDFKLGRKRKISRHLKYIAFPWLHAHS
jgi:hypothetical protein